MAHFSYTSNDKAYVVLDGKENKMFQQVDDYFRNWALEQNAEEYTFPSMISKEVLDQCGYFESFPQHLTSAAYINENCYDEVSKNKAADKENMNISNLFFTPAACLHIYPCLTGKKIEEAIITTQAQVYRYETKQYDGKVRLWNFHVREIVFAGKQEFVDDCLNRIMDEALKFSSTVGLDVELSDSSDHFYPSKRNLIKSRLQQTNSMKKELTTRIDGKEIALASFNSHDTHFSEPFHFSQNKQVVTGCVGFGLERWVNALASNM